MTNPETKKTLWQTMLGTIQGTSGEGSAKRICMAFFCLCIIMPSKIVYLVCFYLSAISLAPTSVQVLVIKMYQPLTWTEHLSLWMFAGLATFEGVVALLKWIRGGNANEKGTNPEQK